MNEFIHNYITVNYNLFRTSLQVSMAGARTRYKAGFAELIPLLLFYLAQFVIVFSIFSVINGEKIARVDLVTFFIIMISIDSIGDALLFKGLQEYIRSIRRGQALYYVLTPGAPLFKIIFFRWDFPMLVLGLFFFVLANGLGWIFYQVSPLYISGAIFLGVLTHVVLTGAFHIIQCYYDPRMPIPLGSPASRLYTKPLHLMMTGGLAFIVMISLYPAFMITAFPSMITTKMQSMQLDISYAALVAIAIGSLISWIALLNLFIKKTCKERQG